jgi:hypothetical protein
VNRGGWWTTVFLLSAPRYPDVPHQPDVKLARWELLAALLHARLPGFKYDSTQLKIQQGGDFQVRAQQLP